MKKTKILLLLSTFMLVACNADKPSATPSVSVEQSVSTPEPVVTKHNVVLPTSLENAFVTADKTQAAEGDMVTLTVAITNSDFVITAVKMNGTVLNGTEDEVVESVFHYNFLMGDSDAEVDVELFDTTIRDHAIVFENNDLAFPIGLPEGANVGDTVEFKISIISGNELSSVEVLDAEDAPVEVEGNPVAGYSFEMPDSDVKVIAHTLGGYFKISVSDDLLFDEEEYKTSDVVYGFLNDDGTVTSLLSTFVRAGETFKVVGKHQYGFEGTHFFANDVEMIHDEESEYYVFEATMPGKDVEIKAVAEKRTIDIELDTNDEAVDTIIYKADDTSKTPITSAKPGDTLRIEAKLKEGKSEDFSLRDINAYFNEYSNNRAQTFTKQSLSSSPVSWSSTSSYVTFAYVDANTKEFILSSSRYYADNKVTVSLGVTDLKKYQDAAFLGDWYAQEFYNYKIYSSGSGKGTFSINAAGITSGTPSYMNNASIVSGEPTDYVFKLADGRTILFNNNYTLGAVEYSSSNIGKMNELFILTKGTTAPTYDTYTDATNKFFITRVIVGETCIGAVYADDNLDGLKFMLGSVEFVGETKTLEETGSKFFFKDADGNIVKAVGIGSEMGEYTSEDGKVLSLDGLGNAILDDQEGTYIVKSTGIEVKIETTKYVITINHEDMSFVIVSESEIVPTDDPFAGLSFSGQVMIEDLWDDTSSNPYNVTFTITVIFNDDGTLDFSQQSNKTQVTYANFSYEGLEYVYDKDAGTASFQWTKNQFSGTCTMVLEASGSQLRFTTDLPNVDDGVNTIINAN